MGETDELRAAYNAMPYPGQAFRDTHPDWLSVRAAVAGHAAPPVGRCRVLEVGCATGGNLLPMAATLPGGTFVGIDLSDAQVERGRATAKAAGLANVDLRCQDLTTFDPAGEPPFDYVVAHGVYSWTPPAVRDRLLAICGAALSPAGVAYVSYNTLPGWHLRRVARDLMAFAAEGVGGLPEQVAAGRAMIDLVNEPSPNVGEYKAVVRNLKQMADSAQDWYLAHEELEPINDPVYFREFAAHAAGHGLRYLIGTTPRNEYYAYLAKPLKDRVDRLSKGDPIGREHLLDLLSGQTFRRSLMCRADAAAAAVPDGPAVVRRSHVAANPTFTPREGGLLVGSPSSPHVVPVNDPHMIAAFRHLGRAWPHAVAFDDLLATYTADTGTVLDPDPPAALANNLFWCAQLEMAEVWGRPTATVFAAAGAGGNPRATPLARVQAATELTVANLRHDVTNVDPILRHVLPLLDGTRGPSKLGRDVAALFAAGKLPAGCLNAYGAWSATSAGDVSALLKRFADLSLLAA